jgi:hypothetical protein
MLEISIKREWKGRSSDALIGLLVVDEDGIIESDHDEQMDSFRPFCETLAVALGDIVIKSCPMPKGARLTFSHGGQSVALAIQDEPDDKIGEMVGAIAADTALKFAVIYWQSRGWTTPEMNL